MPRFTATMSINRLELILRCLRVDNILDIGAYNALVIWMTLNPNWKDCVHYIFNEETPSPRSSESDRVCLIAIFLFSENVIAYVMGCKEIQMLHCLTPDEGKAVLSC
ncbi:hypothetical protein QE152_g23478 [Popillia japonica]|uniref:Uncharacterized protein n=1 Tax=Popillia japonica TaxID=7064 RepID=A0AAW1KHD3_POPJA